MTAPAAPEAVPPSPREVPGARRYPGPDVVRGVALLGSTVATAGAWLGGRQLGPGFRPLDGGPADRAVDAVTGLLVDNRVLPVFALLLGLGVAVRMGVGPGPAARGAPDPPEAEEWAWALRRGGLLLGLGALHAALVLDADVLGVLGVLLLLAVPLARARTAAHVVVGLLAVPALLVHGAVDGFGGSLGFPDAPQDYLLAVVDRVGTWLFALVLLVPTNGGLLLAVVLGVRLARAGWGQDPARHRRGLLAVGTAASLVGLAGAVPFARVLGAGRLPDVAVGLWAGVLDAVTGPAGALGAVCLLLVAASSLAGAGAGTGAGTAAGRLVAALALLGRRSLPAYLAGSLLLALVLAPWAGGAADRWGSAAATGLAAALWAVALGVALVVTGRDGGRGAAPDGGRPGGGARAPQPSERQGRERSSAT